MDQMVAKAQEWVNTTYKDHPHYKMIEVNGKTGWSTMFALTRALQIELGIATPADSFGAGTLAALQSLGNININSNTKPNIVKIIQSALYCKGYGPGGITGTFGKGTETAIKNVQFNLAGPDLADGIVTPKLFKALLTMDAYVLVNKGKEAIRDVQQWFNRKYIHRKNFYYIPCDGHFSRDVQKALMYAIQYELGMDDATANGNFGPGTKSGLKANELSVGDKDGSKSFVRLFQAAMLFNHNYVEFDGVFNSLLSSRVREFQEFTMLPKTGEGDFATWSSLLVSTGDPARKGKASDAITAVTPARAATLINHGYETIGRYLTNAPNSKLNKKIQPGELKNIFNAGLTVFPIYQTNGAQLSYFSEAKGESDAKAAVDAAVAHGFTKGTTIYFAVDFDAYDHEVSSNILPYFKGVSSKMKELMGSYYKVGVYGARNICSRVSESGYAETSFVSGMSTGFSGNLGFPLPKNWAFDQVSTITIGTGDGKIEIDNNIKSNRYKGERSVNPAEAMGRKKFFELANKIPILKPLADANLVLEQEFPIFDVKVASGYFVMSSKIKDTQPGAAVIEIKNGQIEGALPAHLTTLLGTLSLEHRLKFENMTQELALSIKNGNIETKTAIDGNRINVSLILNYPKIPLTEGMEQDLAFEFKLSFLNLNDAGETIIEFAEEKLVPVAIVGLVIAVLALAFFSSAGAVATGVVGLLVLIGSAIKDAFGNGGSV